MNWYIDWWVKRRSSDKQDLSEVRGYKTEQKILEKPLFYCWLTLTEKLDTKYNTI